MKSYLFLTIPLYLLLSTSCFAKFDQLIIEDTKGITRAIAEISDKGNVKFQLSDNMGKPADDIEVLVTNSGNGEVRSSISKKGHATFQNLTPGTWTVASTVDDITFTNVTITAGAGTIGGAGALAGSAGGLGILSGGSGVSSMIATGVAATAGLATANEIRKEIIKDKKSSTTLSPSS